MKVDWKKRKRKRARKMRLECSGSNPATGSSQVENLERERGEGEEERRKGIEAGEGSNRRDQRGRQEHEKDSLASIRNKQEPLLEHLSLPPSLSLPPPLSLSPSLSLSHSGTHEQQQGDGAKSKEASGDTLTSM